MQDYQVGLQTGLSMLDKTEVSAYRMASAIARLAWVNQYGDAYWTHQDGVGAVEVHFGPSGPTCKCCGEPLDKQKWLRLILGDYAPEFRKLLPPAPGGN